MWDGSELVAQTAAPQTLWCRLTETRRGLHSGKCSEYVDCDQEGESVAHSTGAGQAPAEVNWKTPPGCLAARARLSPTRPWGWLCSFCFAPGSAWSTPTRPARPGTSLVKNQESEHKPEGLSLQHILGHLVEIF